MGEGMSNHPTVTFASWQANSQRGTSQCTSSSLVLDFTMTVIVARDISAANP
jgi:hypothetical protein